LLQIVISTPDFSDGVNFVNQIILENADDISLIKSVNFSDESISFSLPQNDPKISEINFLRWWECWDTETNTRKNFGPIDTIEKPTGENWKISGPGRSAILRDVYKTVQTFYYPIDQFIDDLRYENIAAEPRTSVLIDAHSDSDFYGLSKRTKDDVIDENIGYISPGRETPSQGAIRADQYWAGTDRSDWVTVDLGETYKIARSRILLPWWGANTSSWNRTYDWRYRYSNDNTSFTTIFDTNVPTVRPLGFATIPATRGWSLYTGETGVDSTRAYTIIDDETIGARYWQVNIGNTYARMAVYDGNSFASNWIDEWDWQCGGSNQIHDGNTYNQVYRKSPPMPQTDKLRPENDCNASVVEIEIDKKVINRAHIPSLYYQQINNDNRQITYTHSAEPSETFDAGSSRKFEPGTLFRRVTLSASCDVYDQFNNEIADGATTFITPANSRYILMKGDPDVVVTDVDTWQGKLDPLSFNANYSYSTVKFDTAILHFRGVSLKWYITVPPAVTAGIVSIELREWIKSGAQHWGPWTVLESGLTLPTGVSAYKVWEIPYEDGTLKDETVYELRIVNLNGGYVSIDSFAGYWSASFSELNEDDPRFYQRFPNDIIQEYGEYYSFGSIYKYPTSIAFTVGELTFFGDRVIVYAAKGPGSGSIKLGLVGFDIPGGDDDGGISINLNQTKWLYQAIIFDSKDHFPNLPWQWHTLRIRQRDDSPGPMYLDGAAIHASNGLSVKFANPTTHLDILKSTIEALGMEADLTEAGLNLEPRLGRITDIVMQEGEEITININNTEDISKVATMLQITGANIDGLPLSAVVEDKNTKKRFGRTIQRGYDLNNVADYFSLIGAGRTELIKRKTPERRISVSYVGPEIISHGDSFIAKKRDGTEFQVRAMSITRNQSASSGTTYEIDCAIWPTYDEDDILAGTDTGQSGHKVTPIAHDPLTGGNPDPIYIPPHQTRFLQPGFAKVSIYNPNHFGQAMALIEGPTKNRYGQAQVFIDGVPTEPYNVGEHSFDSEVDLYWTPPNFG
jgi:hypothetical protein